MIFRLIIWGLLIYFIYKTIKYLTRLVSPPSNENRNENIKYKENKSRLNIDQKDIIEAKFEEIKPEEKAKEEEDKKKPESE